MHTSKLISQKKSKFNKIAITTGDVDSIGLEITCKALNQLGPQKKCVFFIFRSSVLIPKQHLLFNLIDKKFARLTFDNIESALVFYNLMEQSNSLDSKFIFDLNLSTSPTEWVLASTYLCKNNYMSSLVTGPLSKSGIYKAGFNFIGHTGLFKSVFPKHKLFMGFIGKYFNVMLATDHIPLNKVEKILSQDQYLNSIFNGALQFSKFFKNKKKIGLLGLNPHAGEKSILGSFENLFFNKKNKKFSIPLSPDAAFLKSEWKKYSFYLCLYHDQGLIPFKMLHGQDSGVHITIGLPFIRTSVDHGTANDIFNLNRANSSSMKDAILTNIKLLRGEKL